MMQLLQSPHLLLSLYSIHVLLAPTTCATDDAACVISVRLEPYLIRVLLGSTIRTADNAA